jgi:hypothetical protein
MVVAMLRKAQVDRWLLARAMARQARKRSGPAMRDRRRWNFSTQQRRRLGDT